MCVDMHAMKCKYSDVGHGSWMIMEEESYEKLEENKREREKQQERLKR